MGTKSFSIGEAVSFGWDTAKKHVGFFVLLIVATIVLEFIPTLAGKAAPENAVMGTVVFLLGLAVGGLVHLGWANVSLRFCDGAKAELGDFFGIFPLILHYVAASILYGIIVMVGLMLLVVPGVMWALRFSLFPYMILEHDCGPIEALKMSSRVTKGGKWDLFGFYFTSMTIVMLGFAAVVLGLIWAVPTAAVATALVYRELLEQSEAAPAAAGAGAAPEAPAASEGPAGPAPSGGPEAGEGPAGSEGPSGGGSPREPDTPGGSPGGPDRSPGGPGGSPGSGA